MDLGVRGEERRLRHYTMGALLFRRGMRRRMKRRKRIGTRLKMFILCFLVYRAPLASSYHQCVQVGLRFGEGRAGGTAFDARGPETDPADRLSSLFCRKRHSIRRLKDRKSIIGYTLCLYRHGTRSRTPLRRFRGAVGGPFSHAFSHKALYCSTTTMPPGASAHVRQDMLKWDDNDNAIDGVSHVVRFSLRLFLLLPSPSHPCAPLPPIRLFLLPSPSHPCASLPPIRTPRDPDPAVHP